MTKPALKKKPTLKTKKPLKKKVVRKSASKRATKEGMTLKGVAKSAATEAGRSVLQITGKQVAKHGLKTLSKKFLGKAASRAFNKVGGPIVDAAFEAAAIAMDPRLTKAQKKRRIASRAVVAAGIVGATLVVPQAVVAIEIGSTVYDIFSN